MRLIALYIGLVFVTNLFATVEDDRRNQLLSIISDELKEVTYIAKQSGGVDPQIMLRQAELFLEKARLIKESENEKYLQIPAAKRAAVNRNIFFSESRKYFENAQKTCDYILKKFSVTREKANILFVMAFNYKEMGDYKKAREFFEGSVRHASPGSVVGARAKLALAEIYYNDTDYAKAIPLYEEALKIEKGKWWTKDSYNLAWCYFKVKNYDRAIYVMNDVYAKGGSAQFIDMQKLAARDLAFFYAQSGQENKAIEFYKKEGGNVAKNLHQVAKHLLDQGKTSVAESVLEDASRLATDEKDKMAIEITLLGLYEKFGKYDKHVVVAESLKAKRSKLSEDDKVVYDYHLKKVSATLQQQVVGKQYAHDKKVVTQKADLAARYFAILAELTPSQKTEYYFLAGETFFSGELYSKAISSYKISNEEAKKINNKKYADLSLNGIMASMSKGGIESDIADKELVSVYNSYLATNPKGDRASKIYQRLFNIHYQAKNLPETEKTLINYRQNFPDQKDIHEAMLARIMDHYKTAGDKVSLNRWVSRITSGEFSVNPAYLKKLKLLLLAMQFEGVNKATTTGDKKKQLQLYLEIYKNPDSSEAKEIAAYNIMTLLYELGDIKRMYMWAMTSVELLSASNLQKYEVTYKTVATELFNRRLLKESANLQNAIFDKLCSVDYSLKDSLFKNAVLLNLAIKDLDNAKNLANLSSYKCKVSLTTIIEAKVELMKAYSESGRWSSNMKELDQLAQSKELANVLITSYAALRKELLSLGQKDSAQQVESKMLALYESANKKDVQVESLDAIAEIKVKRLEHALSKLYEIRLVFPEETFNAALKKMLMEYTTFVSEVSKMQEMGSGEGITQGYDLLLKANNFVSNSISQVELPPEKNETYVAGFRSAMNKYVQPLTESKKQIYKDAIAAIKKHEILSKSNHVFTTQSALPFPIDYSFQKGGVIMDRGGRR